MKLVGGKGKEDPKTHPCQNQTRKDGPPGRNRERLKCQNLLGRAMEPVQGQTDRHFQTG